jgi:phosphoglucosamine mutase
VAVRIDDAVERYIAHCVGTIPVDLSGLKIAVDCGHGAAAGATPEALTRLGAEVFAINCDYNGMDINVGCGSTHLGPITELVRETGADLGIAHDGDADRVLAVDETGAEVDGDMIMAITATHLKAQGKLPEGVVVSTVMANIGFELAMRENGISVVKTKVGDRYVLEQLQTSGAALGGEQSGHIIFLEHNTTGDGLVTALHLAAVMKQTGKPVSELRQVMRRFPQVLVNVPVADKARLATSAVLTDAVREVEAELGESGRVLVRASGTEPLERVMAEASDAETAADVVDRLVAVVRSELG